MLILITRLPIAFVLYAIPLTQHFEAPREHLQQWFTYFSEAKVE
jgi:hypothetical protein